MSLCRRVIAGCIAVAATSETLPAQAAPPAGPLVVVVNQRREDASIIEVGSGRVVARVPLGIEPHEAAVSPNARTVAIAGLNAGLLRARKILLIDVATARPRTIELGAFRGPHGVTWVSDSLLLVASMFDKAVLYVDVPNGRVTRVVSGLGENLYVLHLARSTGRVYVSSPHDNNVTEIDVAGGRALRAFPIPDGPAGMNVSPDGAEVWAAVWRQEVGGAMAVVDVASGSVVARLAGFQQPRRVAFSRDGSRVFVTDPNHLRIVDRAKRQVLASVHLGDRAGGSGVSCTLDAARCYVALSQAGEVVEVDVSAFKVLRRFTVERGADGIIYVPR